MVRAASLALLPLAVLGCSHPPARPSHIEIVATPKDQRGEPYVMPFAEKQDGTGAIINYLLRAQREGARAASDLAIYVSGHDGDRLVTCRRDLLVGAPAPAAATPDAYPRLVTREVTDSVYECKTQGVPVTKTVTSYRPQYNPATHQTLNVPETKEVQGTVDEKNCETVPRTQVATRYEHEIEASFVPPLPETLVPTYTRLELHLGPPVCQPATADKPRFRLEGTIYRS